MPRLPYLFHASGTGRQNNLPKAIKLIRYGCANRPFYHIVLTGLKTSPQLPPIEQLGTFDPCVNKYNEKLVALNYERVLYYMGKGAAISRPVAELLGLAGFLPIHPRSYIKAWRNRRERETRELLDVEKQAESTRLQNTNTTC